MQERVTYTAEETAAVLGLSRTKVYECIRSGKLEAVPVGRKLLVPVAAIEGLLGRPLPRVAGTPPSGSESSSLNQVELVGRLTKDAHLRESKAGRAVCIVRLAIPCRHGDDAVFIDVVTFAEAAEQAAHLVKGQRVWVRGRLDQREWTAEDGSRRQAHQVVARRVEALDRPREARA
ncbi:MAG TPA: single-stranded DNA-binding protein [Actinomycetota bacterium]|nr:single-stranded DNA-binding protein [Actinomycetota bacterium]